MEADVLRPECRKENFDGEKMKGCILVGWDRMKGVKDQSEKMKIVIHKQRDIGGKCGGNV